MRRYRRNVLPLLMGIAAVLISVVAVVWLVDRVRGREAPERTSLRLEVGALGSLDLTALLQLLQQLGRQFGQPFSQGQPFGPGQGFGSERGVPATPPTAGPALGVTVEAQNGRLVVTSVLPGTPAANAGVQRNDVILQVADAAVADVPALRDAIARQAPGSGYGLRIERDGRQQTLHVTAAGTSSSTLRFAPRPDGGAPAPFRQRGGMGSRSGTLG